MIRVAFGLVATAWTLSLAPDLMTFFSRSGVVPVQPSHPFWIGVLSPAAPDWAVYLAWAGLLVSAVALTIGYHARLASVLVFVGILSFERRNPFVFNAGDLLLRNLAIFLMFAPTGAALSIDSWRRVRQRLVEFPARAQWAVRLIQIQLVVVYAETVWAKLRGAPWRNGAAVSYALRLDQYVRFRMPSFITTSAILSHLMTWGTLAVEGSIVVLVWNRRTRPWVLGAGVLMHVAIAVNIMIGFFTMAMLIAYLSFVPPETMERLVARFAARPTVARGIRARRVVSSEPAG
jgi:hypothetical protein